MDVEELESRFREIDDEVSDSDPVKASVEGDTESSGSLSVSVERKVIAGTERGGDAPRSRSVESRTLLDVNLSEVDVPDHYVESAVRKIFSNQGQVGELPPLKIEQVGASQNFRVAEDYAYTAGQHTLTALKGFEYNRSSIPRIFWVIISKDDLSSVAPLFHDLLYRYAGKLPENQNPPEDGIVAPYRTFTREEVDDLFRELMKKSGVRRWRRILAYQAVRRFGGPAWG